jgi:lysophospholipase L1-like esterase
MNRRRFLISSGLALLATQFQSVMNAASPLPDKVKRVVFLGDSITYAGLYVDYIEAVWRLRFPESPVEFLDLGLPSETVSGLSEPGHAGGKFPRPDLHERLDRVLAQTKPDLVIACYGMNDGIYYPLSDERLAAYQQGILTLRRKVEATGAKIIHLTPPVFDSLPILDKTLPAGLEKYEKPYSGYDDVLTRYSEWLLDQRRFGWEVYDVHGPMLQHLEERRKSAPNFIFAKDGVHADATGHWLMAQALLKAWNLDPDKETTSINARQRRVLLGRATGLQVTPDGLSFVWQTKLSQPYDPKWDTASLALAGLDNRMARRELKVINLPNGDYLLKEDGTEIMEVNHKDLYQGVTLVGQPSTALQKRGAELLKLIGRRRKLLSDAWLGATGHQRPGMAKGLPLAEAEAKAAVYGKEIHAFAEPVEVKIELSGRVTTPGKK